MMKISIVLLFLLAGCKKHVYTIGEVCEPVTHTFTADEVQVGVGDTMTYFVFKGKEPFYRRVCADLTFGKADHRWHAGIITDKEYLPTPLFFDMAAAYDYINKQPCERYSK
jgi:hypothetical protein